MARGDLIQYRRGGAAVWASVNPILADGEVGFATDTGSLRVGNGVDAWTALSPIGGGQVSEAQIAAAVEAYLDSLPDSIATQSDLLEAVAGLATVADVVDAIDGLATEAALASAVSNLASHSDLVSAIDAVEAQIPPATSLTWRTTETGLEVSINGGAWELVASKQALSLGYGDGD